MQFTIITASLNYGHFLGDCLQSVADQKGVELEHLILDGGSTDDSCEVAARFPHATWIQESDRGISDSINKGFLRAKGKWVMWLNADDFLEPGALAKVADFIARNPEADVVHGDCTFINGDKTPIRRKYDTPVDEWDLFFIGCVIPSTSTFYRREIIESGHLLDVNYKNAMDLEYYLRLMRLGYRFAYLPEALACFRWHDESTTMKNWQRMIDEALRCKRQHIDARGLPSFLKSAILLKAMRKLFQTRRIIKRLMTHGRLL